MYYHRKPTRSETIQDMLPGNKSHPIYFPNSWTILIGDLECICIKTLDVRETGVARMLIGHFFFRGTEIFWIKSSVETHRPSCFSELGANDDQGWEHINSNAIGRKGRENKIKRHESICSLYQIGSILHFSIKLPSVQHPHSRVLYTCSTSASECLSPVKVGHWSFAAKPLIKSSP